MQGLCSNLLCPPALVCLSAFHHNTTTKQRKYYHLHSLRNTDYHVAELCSYPVAATSLLSISQAAQLLCSALFLEVALSFFYFPLLCSLVHEKALHVSFHASPTSKPNLFLFSLSGRNIFYQTAPFNSLLGLHSLKLSNQLLQKQRTREVGFY